MKTFKSHANFNADSRKRKTEKIVKVISHYHDLSNCSVLDVGCGSGYISSYIGKQAKKLIAIDVVDERKEKSGYQFIKYSINKKFPLNDNLFDIVILNFVLEHVYEKERLLREIHRVMRKGGICYLSVPNKFLIIEPHYKLPFLSIIPKRISNYYIRLFKRGNYYDVFPLFYWQYNQMLNKLGFRVEHISTQVIKKYKFYGLSDSILFRIFSLFPNAIIDRLSFLMPSFIYICFKF